MQQKVIVVAGSLFIFYIFIHFAFMAGRTLNSKEEAQPLSFRGLGQNIGQLDPSVTDDGNETVALAFTIIAPTKSGGFKTNISVAKTSPSCKDWRLGNFTGFSDKQEEIIGPDGVTPVKTGAWRLETPAIVP
jgi:hypothetical protein